MILSNSKGLTLQVDKYLFIGLRPSEKENKIVLLFCVISLVDSLQIVMVICGELVSIT